MSMLLHLHFQHMQDHCHLLSNQSDRDRQKLYLKDHSMNKKSFQGHPLQLQTIEDRRLHNHCRQHKDLCSWSTFQMEERKKLSKI